MTVIMQDELGCVQLDNVEQIQLVDLGTYEIYYADDTKETVSGMIRSISL